MILSKPVPPVSAGGCSRTTEHDSKTDTSFHKFLISSINHNNCLMDAIEQGFFEMDYY
jgi:hypothetical protein